MSDLSLPSSLPALTGQEGSIPISLSDKWNHELEKHGYSIDKGKSIDDYASAFSDASNIPKSAKALQKRVGGDFGRVAIAFRLLTKAIQPSPILRQKSAWFADSEQRIISVMKDEMDTVWQVFDSEVQHLVNVHTQESLNQIGELEEENRGLAKFIEELQEQEKDIDERNVRLQEIETKLAHAEQVCSDYRQQLDITQKELRELLLVKTELSLTTSRYEMLEQQYSVLSEDKQRLLDDNAKLMNMVTQLQNQHIIEAHELEDDFLSDGFDINEFIPNQSDSESCPQSEEPTKK